MNGNSPSNCTSITAPITWVTRPTILLAISRSPLSDSFGTGDDLNQFLGDVRLARAVVVQRQAVDHVPGVTCRIVHRSHARPVLARRAFQERMIDLDGERLRQQAREDGLLIGFE